MENAIGGVVTRASKDANGPGKDDVWISPPGPGAPCSGPGKLGGQGTLVKMGYTRAWFWPLQLLALRLVILSNTYKDTHIPDRPSSTCA